jgi:hypothetical protein
MRLRSDSYAYPQLDGLTPTALNQTTPTSAPKTSNFCCPTKRYALPMTRIDCCRGQCTAVNERCGNAIGDHRRVVDSTPAPQIPVSSARIGSGSGTWGIRALAGI